MLKLDDLYISEEIQSALDTYETKYLNKSLDDALTDKQSDQLCDLLQAARKKAFEVGYKTAISLILMGTME